MATLKFDQLTDPTPTLGGTLLAPFTITKDGKFAIAWSGASDKAQIYKNTNSVWAKLANGTGSVTANNNRKPGSFNPAEDKIVIPRTTAAANPVICSFDKVTPNVTVDTVNNSVAFSMPSAAFHPTLDVVACGFTPTAPNVLQLWKKSATATWDLFGSGIANPATYVTNFVAWTKDGTKLIVGLSASPFMIVYDFNSTTGALTARGTAYDSSPGAITGGAINPITDDLILCSATTPGFKYLKWDNAAGYWKLQTVTATGTTGGYSAAWTLEGDHFIMFHSTAVDPRVYDIDPSTGALTFAFTVPLGVSTITYTGGFTTLSYAIIGFNQAIAIKFFTFRTSAEKFDVSGFLPTTKVTGSGTPLINIGTVVTAGFLPTTAVAAGTRQKAAIDANGFLPTTAIAAKTRQKAAMSISGFLPTTHLDALVQPDAVIRTSGFLPTTSIQAGTKQRVNADMSGFLPTTKVMAGTRQKAAIDTNGFLPTTKVLGGAAKSIGQMPTVGFLPTTHIDAVNKNSANIAVSSFLPTTHVVAYVKNLGAIDVSGFLPTTHIDAHQPIERVATIATSGFLPTTKVVAYAEPQPEDGGGSTGPGFGGGSGGINLNGPVLGGGTALRVG